MKLFIGVVLLFLITTTYSERTLEEQNHEDIEPSSLNVEDENINEHSKRTIGIKHPGYVKHVGIHPLGHKYLLGYGHVDYKYVPVIKPLALKPVSHAHAWRPHLKPVRLLPTKPVRKPIYNNQGWKPIIPPNVPLPSQHPAKPWVDHKPSISLQPPFSASGHHDVHIQPSPGGVPGIDVRPVFEAPVVPFPPAPVHPVIPPQFVYPTHFHQTLPLPPPYFHLHKPQLPVLPLGAAFSPELLHAKTHVPHPLFPVGVAHAAPPQTVFSAALPPPPVYPAIAPHVVPLPAPIYPPQPVQAPLPLPPQPLPPHAFIPTHPHGIVPGVPQTFVPDHVYPAIPTPHLHPAPPSPVLPLPHAVAPQPVNPHRFHPSAVAPEPIPFPAPSGVEFHGKAAHLIPISKPSFGIPHVALNKPHLPDIPIPTDTHFNPGVQAPRDQFEQHPQGHFIPGINQIPPNHINPDVNFAHHNINPDVNFPHHNLVPNDESNPQFSPTNLNPHLPDVTHHFAPQPHDFGNNLPEQQPGVSIQPGQTDLQIPFHLPNHPTFRQRDVFQQNPIEHIPNPHEVSNSPTGTDATFNGYVK